VFALVLTVVSGCALLFSLRPATYLAANAGPRAPFGLAVFIAYEVGMWFYAYRNDEGYAAAALAGLGLSAPAVASLFIPQVSDQPLQLDVLLLSLYLAISHFAYAIANWRMATKSWLDF